MSWMAWGNYASVREESVVRPLRLLSPSPPALCPTAAPNRNRPVAQTAPNRHLLANFFVCKLFGFGNMAIETRNDIDVNKNVIDGIFCGIDVS
jgi:hypothetical protein